MSSLEDGEVVSLITIVLDFLGYLARANPSDMILHGASHVESWISDGVDADLHMALLDIHHSIFDCLSHLHSLHEDGESSSGERADGELLTRGQALSGIDDAHIVEFNR